MTKKMIKDAYLELLEYHPSEKISVTNICKAADVNRSTFYMYYEDVIVLRREIEDDVLEQIPILSDTSEIITSDKQFVDILEQFFLNVQKNQRMFRILIQSDNKTFNRRLIDTILKKYHVKSRIKNPLFAEYQYVYIVSGVIGLLGAWIESSFPISARQISEFILQMSIATDTINDDFVQNPS
ncbi:MAG: TetR/AcrR family transcriptional regulator [Eubacterium sp.]|nr:TetR/AcrR family transcriptional regulator [Eubacterium sp.]